MRSEGIKSEMNSAGASSLTTIGSKGKSNKMNTANPSTSAFSQQIAKAPATVSSSSSLEDVHAFAQVSVADPLAASSGVNEAFTPALGVSTQMPYAVPPKPASATLVTDPLSRTISHTAAATMYIPTQHIPIMPSIASATMPTAAAPATEQNNNTVAEFLYQLTKMLTDNNREVIEWANGKIEVHNPHKLASDVLHKYFRHSKFASFQRQLNYFGFRKLAGKGKMSPCSYVNDATTSELGSLLRIKRKTSVPTSKDKNGRKRPRSNSNAESNAKSASRTGGMGTAPVNPVLAGILHSSGSYSHSKRVDTSPTTSAHLAVGKGVKHQLNGYQKRSAANLPSTNSHKALAHLAVGKGVRHNYASASPLTKKLTAGRATAALINANATFQDPPQLGVTDIQTSLSELTNNFREATSATEGNDGERGTSYGMLSRDSSLVDLAMLAPVTSVDPTPVSEMASSSGTALTFVDFPHEELNPSNGSS